MFEHYPIEEHLCITDECAERIMSLLQKRLDELEELRDAINDRYPFEDLELKWDEIDDEEKLIRGLLEHLAIYTEEIKNQKKKDWSPTNGVNGRPWC